MVLQIIHLSILKPDKTRDPMPEQGWTGGWPGDRARPGPGGQTLRGEVAWEGALAGGPQVVRTARDARRRGRQVRLTRERYRIQID